MGKKILITGGAGYLGMFLSQYLSLSGYTVRVVDAAFLSDDPSAKNSENILKNHYVEVIAGDIRDKKLMEFAVSGIDFVIHLASEEGITQSLSRFSDFIDINTRGTAMLMEVLSENPVERLVLASSMSIYGEGLLADLAGNYYHFAERSLEDLKTGKWEFYGPNKEELISLPTPETQPPHPLSIYAQTKYSQERLCQILGKAQQVPVTVLRFSNIYGPSFHTKKAFTGVLPGFIQKLLQNKAPLIFEDGLQKRDFIHIKDATRALRLTLENSSSIDTVLNIGSGNQLSIRELALKLAIILGKNRIQPEITRKYRFGDIRHCFPDTSKAFALLNFKGEVELDQGILEYADWFTATFPLEKTEMVYKIE